MSVLLSQNAGFQRYIRGGFPRKAWATREIISSAIKIKNKTFAMPAAAPAMPPKPNTPAISAIIKNINDQPSMFPPCHFCLQFF
tara:strand:- start:4134 stop:4385 length:252 start_codon:yes stop_codon:yes gene_type:complete